LEEEDAQPPEMPTADSLSKRRRKHNQDADEGFATLSRELCIDPRTQKIIILKKAIHAIDSMQGNPKAYLDDDVLLAGKHITNANLRYRKKMKILRGMLADRLDMDAGITVAEELLAAVRYLQRSDRCQKS
jgi:hypothetical protein